MKSFARLALVGAIAGLVSMNSFAIGQITGSKVVQVRVDKDGKGMVVFEVVLGGSRPSCSSSYPNALAFDANTAGGKSVLAMALAAKISGQLVSAYGKGACAVYGNYVEDWDYGLLQ